MKIARRSLAAKYFSKRGKDGGFDFTAIAQKAMGLVGSDVYYAHITDPEHSMIPTVSKCKIVGVHLIDLAGDHSRDGWCYPRVRFDVKIGEAQPRGWLIDSNQLYLNTEDVEADTKHMVGGFFRYVNERVGSVIRSAEFLKEDVDKWQRLMETFKKHGWPTEWKFKDKAREALFAKAVETFSTSGEEAKA